MFFTNYTYGINLITVIVSDMEKSKIKEKYNVFL